MTDAFKEVLEILEKHTRLHSQASGIHGEMIEVLLSQSTVLADLEKRIKELEQVKTELQEMRENQPPI